MLHLESTTTLSPEQEVARKRIQDTFNVFKASPTTEILRILTNYIKDAKAKGVDVSSIESQLPELEQQAYRHEVMDTLAILRNSPSTSMFNILQEWIHDAEAKGIDVSAIKSQLPELEKQALQGDVTFSLNTFKHSP